MPEHQNILVVCGTHGQFVDLRERWAIDYAMRHAPVGDLMTGQFYARVDPEMYPCPDRLLFFRTSEQLMGIRYDLVVLTGTWYRKRSVHDELSMIRAYCPHAQWVNETTPIYVFAVDENAFLNYCQERFLEPFVDAVFVRAGDDGSVGPTLESLHMSDPTAHYDIAPERMSPFQHMTITTVSIPPIEQWPPSWRGTQTREWPTWLDDQNRAFLEECFPYWSRLRISCVEMLEWVKMGHTWSKFVQDPRLLVCWITYTRRADVPLARVWADAYYHLYCLCGSPT